MRTFRRHFTRIQTGVQTGVHTPCRRDADGVQTDYSHTPLPPRR